MIALECQYWEYNDEQQKIYDLDNSSDLNIEEGNLKTITFYTIDNLTPYRENKYCLLSSGGTVYLVNASYEKIKSRIEKNVMFIYS